MGLVYTNIDTLNGARLCLFPMAMLIPILQLLNGNICASTYKLPIYVFKQYSADINDDTDIHFADTGKWVQANCMCCHWGLQV